MPVAHLFSAYIGFGKTTIAKEIESKTGAVRVTPDDIIKEMFGTNISDDFMSKAAQAEQVAWNRIQQAIQNGKDVIYDAGYWTPESRKYATERIMSLGAKPVWHQIQCDISVAKRRTLARSQSGNELSIDEKFFNENLAKYSPISIDEKLNVIYHDNSVVKNLMALKAKTGENI